MTKPIIIAICGKSASGKNTLANELYKFLIKKNENTSLIVANTTRPCRYYEESGKDYNFVSHIDFLNGVYNEEYLEWTTFKGWKYGTHKDAISDGINIGVFNPKALKKMLKLQTKYTVVPILLNENLFIRLKRSYQREKRWKWEYLRRAWNDHKDFKNIDNDIKRNKYWLIFNHCEVTEIAYDVKLFLERERLI